jgi:tetratricopeptide (TPR) repeat protein
MSAHLQRGQLLISQARYELAEAELGLALAENPDNALAHALMGLCMLKRERYVPATEHAAKAIGLAPDRAFNHYVLAAVWAERNYLDKAEASIRQAIAIDPENPDYHWLLGHIFTAQSKWKDALEQAGQALAIDSQHVDSLNLRAYCLRQLGQGEAAQKELLSSLRVAPESAGSHSNLGWNYLKQGNRAKATEHFREALRLTPELESARRGVVETLASYNPIYRPIFKYAMAMSRLSSRGQWIVILGGWFGYQLLRQAATAIPTLAPFLIPVMLVYLLFVLGTWIGRPLTYLALRLHPFGRLALSRDERMESNWIGGFALLSLGFAAIYFFMWDGAIAVFAALFFFLMLFPLAATFSRSHARLPMVAYTLVVGLLGLTGFGAWFLSQGRPAGTDDPLRSFGDLCFMGFVWGCFLSLIASNVIGTVRWKKG